MPEPKLYIFTGNPRAPIPDGFELADVDAVIDGQPHKALHVWTGDGDPDLFQWEVWDGEVAAVPDVPEAA